MTDKGILFSAPMVRALLEGRKTQTRRLCQWANNPNSPALTYIVACDKPGWFGDEEGEVQFRVPYVPGDRLWVRETWGINDYRYIFGPSPKARPDDISEWALIYFATEDDCEIQNEMPRRPSIFMPRWASRLTLAVTDVRVQRLQDISEADALAEGIDRISFPEAGDWGWHQRSYAKLWDTLHDKPGTRWDDNPWIVAVTFDVRHGNIDAEGPLT